MKPVFLDTSYWLALEVEDDQYHQSALLHWNSFQGRYPLLVITTAIFDEVVTILNARGEHKRAVASGNKLLHSFFIRLFHVDQPLFFESWAYLVQHQDKEYSLADCISFVLMERMHIQTALTFDHHFAQAGFVQVP